MDRNIEKKSTIYTKVTRRLAAMGTAATLFFTAACTNAIEGQPAVASQEAGATPLNMQQKFNTLLGRVASIGMCFVTEDSRVERRPNKSALATPPLYDAENGPPQLHLIAQTDLFTEPAADLSIYMGVEGRYSQPPPGKKSDHTTLIVNLTMQADSALASADELSKDMLAADEVDIAGDASLTVVDKQGAGEILYKEAGRLTFRYTEDASNVRKPINGTYLNDFETKVTATTKHLQRFAQSDCH